MPNLFHHFASHAAHLTNQSLSIVVVMEFRILFILFLFIQVVPSMVKKTIQLYETMIVRHGVMTVGPTGGGKTTSYEVSRQYVIQ